MALSRQRIHPGGESPFAHEREAIAHVLEVLDDRDPFQAWPLQEFVDRSTGELLEVDLIVLGPNALYLIEIKSYPDGARLAGDAIDWRWLKPGDANWRFFANPLRGANRKAKVLKGLLGKENDQVRVEALVFVSSKDLDSSKLTPDGKNHVVFRRQIKDALTDAAFPGAHPNLPNCSIDRQRAKAIVQQLASVGIRAARKEQRFGSWILQGEIDRGPGYQEYLAFHASLAKNQDSGQARVRVYRRPAHEDSREHQQRLQKIAEREFQNLYQLRDCSQILQPRDYCENTTSHEPAIAFEAFDGAAQFSSFLRQNPDLSFVARLSVVEQVAHALHACHRKQVLHRGLHPGCVLVRESRGDSERLEVRVAGFQHARDFDTSTLQTLHATELESPQFLLYRAPELLGGQDSGSPESDSFSLAAFAYFAFTGRPPANNAYELVRILREQNGLRPGLVQDDLTLLDPIFQNATQAESLRRPNPLEFFEQLENALTAPSTEHLLADPRTARPDDQLEGGFLVIRELGRGSSARVLEVTGPSDQHEALKIPIDASREELLRAEAEVLQQLEHHGVVRLVDVVRPSGVTCLRLRLADPETLGDRLRQKGPLSLDIARRYGIDLLDTLKYLEHKGITHRDIKPHNLGFVRDVGKKESRLLLFDFSLSPVDPTKVALGTVAYRDPWLSDRRVWDAAADRYAAAVTLHELLTGVRPDYGEGIHPASVRDPKPRIDGSRFDGSVRGDLVAFFEKALAPRHEDRHQSAEDMRYEWESAFRAPKVAAVADEIAATTKAQEVPANPFELGDDLQPDTPLAAFVNSPLLLDALERGGAETALDTARLPRNRLSAVPGIGKETQGLVLDLVTILRQRFAAVLTAQEPLLPGYRLAAEPLLSLPRDLLPRETLQLLVDAGIRTTTELAAAPPEQIDRVLRPARIKATKVRRHLEAYQDQADSQGVPPSTLDGWLDLLLAAGKLDPKRTAGGALQLTKTKRAGWAWLGLPTDDDQANQQLGQRAEDPFAAFARTSQIAAALGVSQPTVSNAIGKARDQWQAHPHKDALVELVHEALAALGGAASLADTADRLLRYLGPAATPTDPAEAPTGSPTASDALTGRRATALLRIVTLLHDRDQQPALILDTHHGTTWCSRDTTRLRAAAALGKAADELVTGKSADDSPVPSFAAARQTLEDTVRDQLREELPPPELLLPLAARASKHTACSRKLELYPRGLAAQTALNLARAAVQSALPPHARPDEAVPAQRLRELVRERYPEASPLPDHPDLDPLLEPYGLVWSDHAHGYTRRPEETAQPTIQRTRPTRTTTLDGPRPVPSERELRAREFEDRLRLAREKRAFRLVQCLDTEYDDSIAALSTFLQVAPTSFDRLLIDRMDALMAELRVDPELARRTDRIGDPRPASPGGGTATAAPPRVIEDWKRLCGLAERAAEQLLPEVTANDAPRLIVHLGLLARYDLSKFLDRWLRACEEGQGHAVFAVVPSEQGDDPTIDGRLPIPLTSLASQRLWVDADWLARSRPSRS